MDLLGRTCFHVVGLNQENFFWNLSQKIKIFGVDRKTQKETIFFCSYKDKKVVKKLLLGNGFEIVGTKDFGLVPRLVNLSKNWGLVAALFSFVIFLIFISRFVFVYKINGLENINKNEVVDFLKNNFSNDINKIECKKIEHALCEKFEKISLVSCVVKGQTLIVNIKEKLNPKSIYGEFVPIVSNKNCKITQINLISGTLNVKVGDYVKEGQILVEPYFFDTSGTKKNVEAKAEIVALVYNEGFAEHYDKRVETYRTGNTFVQEEVMLFGLSLYRNYAQNPFANFECDIEENVLTKNNILPLKIKKTTYYETAQRVVESNFFDVQNEVIKKAKTKALEKCEECDKIIEEYHTTKQMAGVYLVGYCVVSQEKIGVQYDY